MDDNTILIDRTRVMSGGIDELFKREKNERERSITALSKNFDRQLIQCSVIFRKFTISGSPRVDLEGYGFTIT